jgi:hypothetical protein
MMARSSMRLTRVRYLQGDRDSSFGPPMIARALAIVHTCMYDAWAAYDAKAIAPE